MTVNALPFLESRAIYFNTVKNSQSLEIAITYPCRVVERLPVLLDAAYGTWCAQTNRRLKNSCWLTKQ